MKTLLIDYKSNVFARPSGLDDLADFSNKQPMKQVKHHNDIKISIGSGIIIKRLWSWESINMSDSDEAELRSIQQRVSDKITSALKEVDIGGLRSLRAKVFRCSATCCDDKNSSVESVQFCVDNCMSPMEDVDAHLNKEMHDLQ
ncbi:hypothetical protein GJ496_005077, partial [Pomphorhynchus laevis]